MIRYHKTKGWPAEYEIPHGIFKLVYSHHAIEEAKKDGLTNFFYDLNTEYCNVLEIAVEDENLKRVVFKTWYDEEQSICMVCQQIGKRVLKVITVWRARVEDDYEGIDMARYS